MIKEVTSSETRPDGSDSDGSLYAIDSVHAVGKVPAFKINVAFDAVKIPFFIDTSSSVNILDGTTYQKLCRQLGNIQLSKVKMQLKAYGNMTLKVIGKLSYAVEIQHQLLPLEFYDVSGNNGYLLSGNTALEARLLSVPKSAAQQVSLTKATVKKVKDTREETAQEAAYTSVAQKTALFPNVPPRLGKLLNDYGHISHGVGKLKNYQLKLHIDKSVAPVSQPARRVPFPLRHRLAQEIQRLEDMGIIEDAKGPTPWVSPIVVFPKPKDPENLRICVDIRCPNVAIKRENHVTPTIDDFVHGLNGATVFSKLDLTSAYHQIELDEQSRYITTFATHVGLNRYTRINYGTNSAAEIFNTLARQLISDISGTLNVAYDIFVFGKYLSSHDKALRLLLDRLSEKGLTVNPKKCVFYQRSVEFFGYVFSNEGITNYCAGFIPNYATLTAPLRQLAKKYSRWLWTETCQIAFDKIKDVLSSETVMGYFDLKKETEIIIDASPVGLGAMLLQRDPKAGQGKIIAYASQSLTDTEKRYSQLEKEALAIVFGIERFRTYIYGLQFTLVTDHKQLEYLFTMTCLV